MLSNERLIEDGARLRLAAAKLIETAPLHCVCQPCQLTMSKTLFHTVVHVLICVMCARADTSLPVITLQDGKGKSSLAPISISSHWDVLGPFQIGTRGKACRSLSLQGIEERANRVAEAAWGADPLEYLGGFRTLEVDPDVVYHSSIAPNGTVSWSRQRGDRLNAAVDASETTVSIEFPTIDWAFLQSIYGWAALQYQAWARGSVTVGANSAQTVVLYSDSLLEFWVDNESYYGGDFYAYRRAPVVLRLHPGVHRIDLRLVRDVRAMGGIGDPKVHFRIDVQRSKGGLAVIEDQLLVPDMVEMRLASHLASVPVRNEEQEWMDIWSIESLDVRIILVTGVQIGGSLIPLWRTHMISYSLQRCLSNLLRASQGLLHFVCRCRIRNLYSFRSRSVMQ